MRNIRDTRPRIQSGEKKMKTLAINGSHRTGNTEAMLKKILDGAASKDAKIELINLKDKKVEMCKGCMACETTGTCLITDDFPKILEKLFKADVLILGSPNYFNNVSALMKGFFDRMNAHWQNPALKGKKVVLVMPGGNSPESIEKGMSAFSEFPRICKMEVIEKVTPHVDGPKEAQENKELMQKCFSLGEKLASL